VNVFLLLRERKVVKKSFGFQDREWTLHFLAGAVQRHYNFREESLPSNAGEFINEEWIQYISTTIMA
jgi:hypothetical protein